MAVPAGCNGWLQWGQTDYAALYKIFLKELKNFSELTAESKQGAAGFLQNATQWSRDRAAQNK